MFEFGIAVMASEKDTGSDNGNPAVGACVMVL